MSEKSPLFKEMRKEVVDKYNQRGAIPIYLLEESEKEHLIRSLSLEKGDGRYQDVFKCLCSYAVKENSPHLNFKDFFDYILRSEVGKTFGQVNLKYNVEFLIKNLEEHRYAEVIRSSNNDRILNFSLKDPCFLILTQYLDKFYAKKSNYDASVSQLKKVFFFPNYTALVKKFHFSIERIRSFSHIVTENDISKDNLNVENNPQKLLVLDFPNRNPEFDKMESFEIVIGLNLVDKIIINTLIPIVFDIIEKNLNLKKTLDESFIRRGEKVPIDFNKKQSGNLDIYSKEFAKWISNIQAFIEDLGFLENPNKFLSGSSNDRISIKKNKNFIYKSVKLIFVYTHNFIRHEREIKKRNEDKQEDQKLIVKYLCDGIKEAKNKISGTGISELSYRLATWNDIISVNDLSGRKTLEEKYSYSEILELLSIKDEDANISKIIEIKANDNKFYLHCWRLLDVFCSALLLESNRVYESILLKWSSCNPKEIPPLDKFWIKTADLEPTFAALYSFITNFFEAHSENDLLKVLFPNSLESGVYHLHSSDLINIQKYNTKTNSFERISPRIKFEGVKNMLYLDGNTLKRLPLSEVLNFDYSKVLNLAKKKRKKTKNNNNEWSFFEALLDFLVGWLFGSKKADNKKTKAANKKTKVHSPPVLFNLDQVAQKYNVSNKRVNIETKLASLNDEWNKALFDPKSHYPDWSTFHPAKKEELKKNLKKDIDKNKKNNKERVDKVIKKTYSQVDLLKTSDAELTNIADKFAKVFKSRHHNQLREYIKHYIIYINTK